MSYPYQRPRRLRRHPGLRSLVRESNLRPDDFIVPLFIREGEGQREPIASMPGYERYTIDEAVKACRTYQELGLPAVLVFAKIDASHKDNTGKHALDPEGLLPRAISALKEAVPQIIVMSDVALDPYSSYGHDGLVRDQEIINDDSVAVLAEMALVHARAGADLVAPSDMMDGRIGAIRDKLESAGFPHTGIMAYSAKYASAFYGPFRDALDSAPGFGDKKTYQMDPANSDEALREVELDLMEGADVVMVKPGLPYLDIVQRVKSTFEAPVSVYQVSGEYSMLQAAAQQGWLDARACALESLTAFKRAGADMIASYWAVQAARWLQDEA